MNGWILVGVLIFLGGFFIGGAVTFAVDSWILRMAWKYQDLAWAAMRERDALRRLVESGLETSPYRDGGSK